MPIQSFKYRCYPTPKQKEHLSKTFGSVRYVFNHFLHVRKEAWYERKESIGHAQTDRMLTVLKQQPETSWLKEISSVPLQQALRHLQTAYVNFWKKRTHYPKFKKKIERQSASYTKMAFSWNMKTRTLRLAKMGKLKIKWSRTFRTYPSMVTISRTTAGHYFVSLQVNEPTQNMQPATKQIGIDIGLTYTLTTSEGEKVPNPKYGARYQRRLARAQRLLSCKQVRSKNREKARLKAAKIHDKITRSRLDHLHKLSTRLIRENQAIYAENLPIKNMISNGNLGKHIVDVGWSKLINQLKYKAKWYGRIFHQIDRFYPSSKRCSTCGYVWEQLTWGMGTWTCSQCNTVHDRDHNAAKNIEACGRADRRVKACGANVSPANSTESEGYSR